MVLVNGKLITGDLIVKNILFMLLSLSFLFSAGCSEETAQLANGQPVPGFHLQKLAGSDTRFPDDYRGKVIALRFWADWCPFCESEMTALEPVHQKYREQGLVILALNVRQDRETAQKFIDKLDISYDVLLDTDGEVARAYGVLGLPTTFFVDDQGVLQKRILGESTPEVFEEIVQELIR